MPTSNTTTLQVSASDIRIGDVIRFRMSKYDPIKWLTVTGLLATQSGKRIGVDMVDEKGVWHYDLVSKKETRQVRRGQ